MRSIALASGKTVPLYTWKGQPVLNQIGIARAHGISPGTVSRAVNRHMNELRQGKDFFELDYDESRQFLQQMGGSRSNYNGKKTRLFTKTGYAIIACTFQGSKAAIIRRALVDNYFGVVDADTVPESRTPVPAPAAPEPINITPVAVNDAGNQLILKAYEVMQKTVESQQAMIEHQGTMMEKLAGTMERLCSFIENRDKAALPPATPALDRWKIRDGEATLTTLAERCNWYSPTGKPHVQFVGHVLRSLGVRTNQSYEYEDEFSRNVIMSTDDDGEHASYFLYIKPSGIQLLVDWCEKTDYARKLKRVERYQNTYGIHRAGDIKCTYYLLETSAVPHVCKAGKKKYLLKDF